MRKLILPLALGAVVAMSSMAFAAVDHTSNGTLKAIDAKACTVKIDKTVYHFAKGCDFAAFKVGEKVTVTAHVYKKMEVGTKLVADMTPAKPAPAKPAKPMTTTTKTTTPVKKS
ncbi:MAG: hypothetical protein ABI398_07615 [Devosia sp.]